MSPYTTFPQFAGKYDHFLNIVYCTHYQNYLSLDTEKLPTSKVLTPVQYCICVLDMMGAGFNNCDIDRAIQDDCFTLWVMTAAAIIDFSKKELWTNVETTFNMLTAHLCNNNTLLLVYLKLQRHVNTSHSINSPWILSSLYSLLHMKFYVLRAVQ